MIKLAQFNNLSAVRLLSLLMILGALLLVVPGQGHAARDKEDPTAQLSKLQSVMFSYADKYMSAIAQVALFAQKRDPTNPELRLRMHSLKLLVTATVQGLAVSPNPESTLLDMRGGLVPQAIRGRGREYDPSYAGFGKGDLGYCQWLPDRERNHRSPQVDSHLEVRKPRSQGGLLHPLQRFRFDAI